MLQKMTEKRRLRRHQLNTQMIIEDSFSQDKLGQLANIHQEGLMIVGRFLEINSIYQVRIQLPNSINQQTSIELGIECLWSQQVDESRELFWTGCSIIDKSPMANACIDKLINLLI